MCRSLSHTVANGNHHDELFSVRGLENIGDLLECQSYPACVESQRLCHKNDLLTVIAALLIKLLILFTHQREIVFNACKLSVMRKPTAKCHRLIADELDVQAALAVAFVYDFLQCLQRLALNGLVCVAAHRMARPHCFHGIHTKFLRQIKIPLQWSISCWMICAVQPVKVLSRVCIASFWYRTLMERYRFALRVPTSERQPSSAS